MRTSSAKSSSSPTPSSSAPRAFLSAAAVSASSTEASLRSPTSDGPGLATSDPLPLPGSVPRRGGGDVGGGGGDDRRGRLRRSHVYTGCPSSRFAGVLSGTGTSSNRCCRGRRLGQLEGAGLPPAAGVRGRPGDGADATNAGPGLRLAGGGAAATSATTPGGARSLSWLAPPADADAHTRRCPRGGDTSDKPGDELPTGLAAPLPGRSGEEAAAAMAGPAEDRGRPGPDAPGVGVTAVHGNVADASEAAVARTSAGGGGRVPGADRMRRRGCRDGNGAVDGVGSAPMVDGSAGAGAGARAPAGPATGRAVSSSGKGRYEEAGRPLLPPPPLPGAGPLAASSNDPMWSPARSSDWVASRCVSCVAEVSPYRMGGTTAGRRTRPRGRTRRTRTGGGKPHPPARQPSE